MSKCHLRRMCPQADVMLQRCCSGRRQHGTRSSEPMSGLCRLSGASTCLNLDHTM